MLDPRPGRCGTDRVQGRRLAGAQYKKLRDVLGLLRDAYCRHIGVEYAHILDPEQKEWLEQRVETKHVKPLWPNEIHPQQKLRRQC